MKALEKAEGRGSNPYYAGNFDGESDELRDLRLSLVAERDALKVELEAECEETKRWLVKAQNERDARKELEAELERIKALEPVAWANPNDMIDAGTSFRWICIGDFTEPLYALGSKTA